MSALERNFPMELSRFIKTYDGAVPEEVCKHAVKLFNEQDDKEDWDRDGCPQFTQFNITEFLDKKEDQENRGDWDIIQYALIQSAHEYVKQYMDENDCRKFFPDRSSLEQFRMKKYRKGTDDRFEKHVDVADHMSAKRFLCMFWYLNDVEEGGETAFDGLSIQPKRGRLLIFPPLWVFPHEAKPTISDDKYIVGSYSHYV